MYTSDDNQSTAETCSPATFYFKLKGLNFEPPPPAAPSARRGLLTAVVANAITTFLCSMSCRRVLHPVSAPAPPPVHRPPAPVSRRVGRRLGAFCRPPAAR
ncbi:hypothetical protein EVAR_62071_1 [Eumeta japonica]|uniref:Uncharacterized protein n=1 Tax=Eumeta variegata TaxID=151549 RepID=A0A4C1YVA9_EUMVA|nr:hypothetical protein EVAR_62071_1 [Eumeta japonica]